MGVGAAIAAVALGATLIEKHFTLRRADGGVDSAFSMEPEEFKLLRCETERAWQALGETRYGGSQAEEKSKAFRRSIYVATPVRAGEVLRAEHLRIVRPGFGLAPKFYDTVLGKRASRDLAPGCPLAWDCIG
jgi:N-acetylneuraminate synthase